ncbi:hypothetical protein M9H77_03405 [Catharanthus roseus]|uniref:Uncharacterized protein n=1 Tax=Catharanthus roseus TaxID=4058 RepID=A0ACC0CB50_CATRO|nr:hypothetical protein M9H77_03405 [Catharanthus roseus]
MEMKKIACAVIIAAASMSTILAAESPIESPAGAPIAAASDSIAAFPAIGTMVGASLLSFFAYYMH